MKGTTLMFLILLIPLAVAFLWDSTPIIKESAHLVFDPTIGALLNWSLNIGFIFIVAVFTLITVLVQKYATDQDLLKTIKEEQKIVQQEMKLAKENPEKTMELSKKSLELTMKAMPIAMRPLIYTSIPFILSLRWFGDYFSVANVKVFGFFGWIWAYILFSIVFSIIFRKALKVH